ncbi:3034_t:CDS:2 [Funneliformis geosporum]|uniref:cystathionine gamma-synthase n=1 Tax=Funneliformis geosporum TaxID=1117311 RepID=A0A9W4WWZ4_9GLOM|nr:3034_t:CDS:2 [Funneliformis geosporum]CAI2178439.1 9863_t:CDS:2 [Funneliformis geosporum]
MPNLSPPTEIGCPIPANTPHAISVTLPTWQDNVDYEEAVDRVVSRMECGYPRFFIHPQIKKLITVCDQKFAKPTETSLLFPSRKPTQRCRDYIHRYYKPTTPPLTSSSSQTPTPCVRLAEITVIPPDKIKSSFHGSVTLHVVLFPKDAFPIAKSFWQHAGEGISSRCAEYCLHIMQAKNDEQYSITDNYNEKSTPVSASSRKHTFHKRYSLNTQISNIYRDSFSNGPISPTSPTSPTVLTSTDKSATVEENYYVEERYGRNLPISFADKAKIALRRRIAGVLGIEEQYNNKNDDNLDDVINRKLESACATERGVNGVTEDDVFLFPSGMSSIFHAHRYILNGFLPSKSICFGFPYIDTLKILEKFGPGCHFYGNGSTEDIDHLTDLLASGENILALFCEFPSNPLCKSPDLKRLRLLADKYDFLIVVDETIGNFVNVGVLEWADILVSSLTKIFSGDSNVMGGGLVLNPQRKHYEKLKQLIKQDYEDLVWGEDAIFLERNSRNFRKRILKINENTEELCDFLSKSPKVKKVYYSKYITPEIYSQYKIEKGGYGGLFSLTFYSSKASQQFFDALPIAKGPSLGTNFTLACPYTILAHYLELDWAAKFGVEAGLVRVSVGLENKEKLLEGFQKGLDSINDDEL